MLNVYSMDARAVRCLQSSLFPYLASMFTEWTPELSGCYRPRYYSSVSSPATENSFVREEQPVVLMVSSKSYANTHGGYVQGKMTSSGSVLSSWEKT